MLTSENRILARFIFSESHFVKTTGRIKYAAFMPQKGTTKTSIFHIEGLQEEEIWRIGRNIEKDRPSLKGRADFNEQSVKKTALKIEYDNIPPRHANLIYPNDQSKYMSLALELAENSVLSICQDNA